MSYSRTYHPEVTLYYSGRESYPASEHGGTVHYSGHVTEKITVVIDVDDDPFNHEAGRCRKQVNTLTGTVVAAKVAHVASIAQKAKQVGDTIIGGFFKTVRSEISQQMAELSAVVDSKLIQLNEMLKTLGDKQRQMHSDYNGLKERYTKLFDGLDHQLELRMHNVDEPVFKFVSLSDTRVGVGDNSSMAAASQTAAGDTSRLASRMAAAKSRHLAMTTMESFKDYMMQQRRCERLIQRCMIPDAHSARYYLPVMLFDARQAPGKSQQPQIYAPQELAKAPLTAAQVLQTPATPTSEKDKKRISDDFTAIVSDYFGSRDSAQQRRIQNTLMDLFKSSSL